MSLKVDIVNAILQGVSKIQVIVYYYAVVRVPSDGTPIRVPSVGNRTGVLTVNL